MRIGAGDGWDALEIVHAGFRYRAQRRSRARCAAPSRVIELEAIPLSCGVLTPEGRVVVLPAGTLLYASAASTTPFATLHAEAIAAEEVHGVHDVCDGSGRCVRSPPLPAGPASWLVSVEDPSGASFRLHAWVRTPAETLPDAPAELRTFEALPPPLEWPAP